MRGEIVLNDISYDDDRINILTSDFLDFTLRIDIDSERSLKEELEDKSGLKETLESTKYYNELEESDHSHELLKKAEYINDNFDNIYNDIEYVSLNFDNIDDKEYIKNNPMILDKKIVLSDVITLDDYEKVENLIKEYDSIKDRIYVNFIFNNGYVSIEDAYKTIKIIKNKAEEILKLNMSPFENIMYTYDIVRNRIYTKENEGESAFKSRDLSEVLLGDKIVCVGYSNIFASLLTYMGIKNRIVQLRDPNDEEKGHERNAIYVVDPKYDVDGVYYFDATWDSRRKDDNKNYLRRYNFFAKTRNEMDEIYPFIDENFPVYDELYEGVKEMLKEYSTCKFTRFIGSLNYALGFTGKERLDVGDYLSSNYSSSKILSDLEDSLSKFDKLLSAETYLKLLNNVRKKEYYNLDYPYSYDELFYTLFASNWEFEENYLCIGELMEKEKDLESKYKIELREFLRADEDKRLLKDTEEVKLTKVLKLTLDKKKEVK